MVVDAKKLVIFAGPHKAAATSVEAFFYQYASGHSRYGPDGHLLTSAERKKTFGLRYWMWPRVTGKVANETDVDAPYKIFGRLVTDHDNDLLENEIMDGIRRAWDTEGLEGVVLGSEEFDQVDGSEGIGVLRYDAMNALRKIVHALEVPPSDVYLVLNYRTPRLDHWASIMAHTSTQQIQSDNFDTEYQNWMCDIDHREMHMETLATQMNPLNAARAFLKEGWKVQVVDMQGVIEAGRDISHVVACDIVTARCEGGAVLNHKADNPHHNALDVKFTSLTEEQRMEAELLFRSLDCSYMDELQENHNFGIIYNHSLWTECDPAKSAIYKKLQEDPTYTYKALLSQLECPGELPFPKNEMISMKVALYGKVVKKNTKRSAGSILFEFCAFIGIMVAAMGYQYHRMVQSGPINPAAFRVPSAVDDDGGAGAANDLDAEYGDPHGDDDEEDEHVTTAKGKYRD